MLQAFQSLLSNELVFLKKKRLLLAVSGGLDSVVLTRLCHRFRLNISLAHCNFHLRAAESDADEDFVIRLGELLNLEVFTQSFDTSVYMKQYGVSLQMAARELRYSWFKELAEQLSFDYVLTAHHADDNLETFLINFTRGTGLNGLTGIPFINGNTVRPLLSFSKDEIATLAQSENWQWREDRSNSTRKYLRNKLRLELVPILKEINPQVIENFKDTIYNLNATADIVKESINAVAKRAICFSNEFEVHYLVSEFKNVNNSRAYLHEIFKSYGFKEWDDVVDLLDAQSGKYLLSNTHRLIKHREVLILADAHPPSFSPIRIEKGDIRIEFPTGVLEISEGYASDKAANRTVNLNLDLLKFPLKLRIWESGDYFYPAGMQGKKKISKYLKDEKCALTEKERIWVLCSGNDILWVVGKRGDKRYLQNTDTLQSLTIELKELP